MKRTDLKLMISESNRLILKDLVIRYSYITDGHREAIEDSARLEVYGVGSDGSKLIGSVILITYAGYTADAMMSKSLTGFGFKVYEYVYFLIKDDVNAKQLAIDNIDMNTTISGSALR